MIFKQKLKIYGCNEYGTVLLTTEKIKVVGNPRENAFYMEKLKERLQNYPIETVSGYGVYDGYLLVVDDIITVRRSK